VLFSPCRLSTLTTLHFPCWLAALPLSLGYCLFAWCSAPLQLSFAFRAALTLHCISLFPNVGSCVNGKPLPPPPNKISDVPPLKGKSPLPKLTVASFYLMHWSPFFYGVVAVSRCIFSTSTRGRSHRWRPVLLLAEQRVNRWRYLLLQRTCAYSNEIYLLCALGPLKKWSLQSICARIWKYHAIALFSTLKLRIFFNRLAPLTHAACVSTRLPPYLCVLLHVQAAACVYRKKSMWTSWCPSPRTPSPLQGRSTTPATWPRLACGSWGGNLSVFSLFFIANTYFNTVHVFLFFFL